MAQHEDDSDTIRQLMPQLLAIARKKGARGTDAEDVVHEAIVSGYKEDRNKPRPSSKDLPAFTGWLFTLVGYATKTHLSQLRRSRIDALADPDRLTSVPDTANPVEIVHDRASIAPAFETLSPEEQDLLVQHVINDVTVADAAQNAGVPYSTQHSRVWRACNNLRENLERLEPGVNKAPRGRRSMFFIPFLGFEQTFVRWCSRAWERLSAVARQARMQATMSLATVVALVVAAPWGTNPSPAPIHGKSPIAASSHHNVVPATVDQTLDGTPTNGSVLSIPVQISAEAHPARAAQSRKVPAQKHSACASQHASAPVNASSWDLSNAVMAAQAIRAGDIREAKRWLDTDAQSRATPDRLRDRLQTSMGTRGMDSSRVVVVAR